MRHFQDVGRAGSINQKIARLDAPDRFVEVDLDCHKLARGAAGRRDDRLYRGRRLVHKERQRRIDHKIAAIGEGGIECVDGNDVGPRCEQIRRTSNGVRLNGQGFLCSLRGNCIIG